LTDVDLVTDFHDCPSSEEENQDSNVKEGRTTSKSDVLGFDAGGSSVDADQKGQVAQVLMKVSPSHKSSSAIFSLPASHVWDETSNEEGNYDESCHDATVRVNSWGAVELGSEHTGLGSEWGDGLVGESPEAPEHGCAEDKTSAGAMENHVGLPSVLHVACACNLEQTEKYPQEEEDETVGERE